MNDVSETPANAEVPTVGTVGISGAMAAPTVDRDATGFPYRPRSRTVPRPRHVPSVGAALARLRLDFGGVLVASFFFCLSLTPSLLPRAWTFQAVVSGITATFGYLIGAAIWAAARRVNAHVWPRWAPSRTAVLRAWSVMLTTALAASIWFVVASVRWQNEIRALMDVDEPGAHYFPATIGVAAVIAGAFLALGRAVRLVARRLRLLLARWVPWPVAAGLSGLTIVGVTAWALTGLLVPTLLGWANTWFAAVNNETEDGHREPTSAFVSGGPGSLVTWDSLGRKGREFVATGPSRADIEDFTGRAAKDPVRAYVGMGEADTPAALADAAVAELDRAGGFDREVLVVVTTTGTGWVDAAAADALEYLYGGDSAIVAVQYSYLPSWISLLVDGEQVRNAGRALFDAVRERWSAEPATSRPELVVYGESLGAIGSGAAFADVEAVRSKVDAALWVGAPAAHDIRARLEAQRDPGSLSRLPRVSNDGVRFWGGWSEPMAAAHDWQRPRILFLQHASDPVTLWSPGLAVSKPDWMIEPPGPDVSTAFDWYPFVTFWQIAADMSVSADVPAGHGHNYGGELVDAWLAVLEPPDWDPGDTPALRNLVRSFPAGGPG